MCKQVNSELQLQSTWIYVFSSLLHFSYLFNCKIKKKKKDSSYICNYWVGWKGLFVITIHPQNSESKCHWINSMSGSWCLHRYFHGKDAPVGYALPAQPLERQKSLMTANSLSWLSENFPSILSTSQIARTLLLGLWLNLLHLSWNW